MGRNEKAAMQVGYQLGMIAARQEAAALAWSRAMLWIMLASRLRVTAREASEVLAMGRAIEETNGNG